MFISETRKELFRVHALEAQSHEAEYLVLCVTVGLCFVLVPLVCATHSCADSLSLWRLHLHLAVFEPCFSCKPGN